MTIAAVAAPQRRLNHLDFIVLSLYWVAIGYLWSSLTALILPDMIIQFVGRENEGVAASLLKGIGTAMAIIWQPIVGGISDRTVTPWGRRRPFIAAGTIGDLLFLTGIALAGSYWLVVVFYMALLFARFLLPMLGFGYSSRFLRFAYQLTEPVLKPLRRYLVVGAFDFSPLVVLFVLQFFGAFLRGALIRM